MAKALPSESPEELGHFVGIETNVGNALTYRILTKNGTVISRRAVRSAGNIQHQNQRAEQTGEPLTPVVRSALDDNDTGEAAPLVIIDPVDLIGTTFDIPNNDGTNDQFWIVQAIRNHHDTTKKRFNPH